MKCMFPEPAEYIGQRSGASWIPSIACMKASSKLVAATKLRCRPKLRPSNTPVPLLHEIQGGLLAMKLRVPFPADLLPRDRLNLSGSAVFQAANDLLLPRGVRILIDDRVKTVDQSTSQLRSLFVGQGESLLEQFLSFRHHERDYIPAGLPHPLLRFWRAPTIAALARIPWSYPACGFAGG